MQDETEIEKLHGSISHIVLNVKTNIGKVFPKLLRKHFAGHINLTRSSI